MSERDGLDAALEHLAHTEGDRAYREAVDAVTDAVDRFRAPTSEGGWNPTERARFCNQDGCKDSWVVGGNYGSPVCRNPNHHDTGGTDG